MDFMDTLYARREGINEFTIYTALKRAVLKGAVLCMFFFMFPGAWFCIPLFVLMFAQCTCLFMLLYFCSFP
jgi:hypothetical protein